MPAQRAAVSITSAGFAPAPRAIVISGTAMIGIIDDATGIMISVINIKSAINARRIGSPAFIVGIAPAIAAETPLFIIALAMEITLTPTILNLIEHLNQAHLDITCYCFKAFLIFK